MTRDPSNKYNATEIRHNAREQWLLNDLSEICPGSLPANLKNQHKAVLNGNFVLQINATFDIGTPAYQQVLKLKQVNMENIEATSKFDDKIPNRRMIQFSFTDGAQYISGIEYKPIRKISCDIIPGSKVLIKGPVTCRRGTLLLMESNMELLGGEVQEMILKHSLPELLMKKLKIPLEQDSNNQTRVANTQVHEAPTLAVENPIPDTRNQIVEVDVHIDQLEAQVSNKRSRINSPDGVVGKKLKRSDEFDTNLARISEDDSDIPTTIEDYSDAPHMFLNEDEELLREIEAKMDEEIGPKYPIYVNPEPFIYIKQINALNKTEVFGEVFKVKAQILKLLDKLSGSKGVWSLKCTLVDGTGCLDVEFTSEVLSEIVGFTPSDMKQLKKDMVSKPELMEKAVTALQKAKDSLQVLNCIVEIKMAEMPKIIALHPFDESHVKALESRLNNFSMQQGL